MFSDILLALSQSMVFTSSLFTISIKSYIFFPVQKKLESSTNETANSIGDTNARSFI